MSKVLNLGNLDLNSFKVSQCAKCNSRDIVEVRGEPSKKEVSDFVRSRAGRLGINLADYDVSIDKATGAVTAVGKDPTDLEINFT